MMKKESFHIEGASMFSVFLYYFQVWSLYGSEYVYDDSNGFTIFGIDPFSQEFFGIFMSPAHYDTIQLCYDLSDLSHSIQLLHVHSDIHTLWILISSSHRWVPPI